MIGFEPKSYLYLLLWMYKMFALRLIHMSRCQLRIGPMLSAEQRKVLIFLNVTVGMIQRIPSNNVPFKTS